MKTLKTVLATTLLALGMTVGGSAFAVNDTCRNFRTIVTNSGAAPIKVTKLRYYDYDVNHWYKENITTRKVSSGDPKTWTRNLRHVDRDDIRLELTYRVKRAFQAGYHPERIIRTSRFECRDNGSRTIRFN